MEEEGALDERLAGVLRALGARLVDRTIPEAALQRGLAGLEAVLEGLDGEPRARWYEAGGFGEGRGDAFDRLSPLRGRLNVVAPPMRVEDGVREDGTPSVVGHATLSSLYEGPPRGVHGGLVAALFDEILGAAMAHAPPPGVTARLEVDYHHLTPLDEPLRLEAWIVEERGRRVRAEATCHAGETLTAKGRALFVRVDFDEALARMRARAAG